MPDQQTSGVGGSWVGPFGVIAWGAVMALGAVVALTALIQLWPTSTASSASSTATSALDGTTTIAPPNTSSSGGALSSSASPTTNPHNGDPYVVLGVHARVPRENVLFVLVALAGALGGFIHSLRSVAWYVGNRTLKRSWLLFYGLLPAVGALLGTVFYLVLRGGLVAGQGTAADVNPYGITATAALVGMFSSQAAEKLKTVFETLLSKASTGSDHTAPAKPSVTGVSPIPRARGSAVDLVRIGTRGSVPRRSSATCRPTHPRYARTPSWSSSFRQEPRRDRFP